MKLNKTLLANQVRNKLVSKCTSAIVTTAFIGGLPFDKDEVAMESQSLVDFSTNLINTMHPETLLDRAYEACEGNSMAQMFIQNIKGDIDSIAEEATRRIMASVSLEGVTAPEVLEEVKLDEKESEKLVNASKKNGLAAVSKVIKDKMIDVIKDEKEAYETSEKLRSEIKEVIRNEKEDLQTENNNAMEDPTEPDEDTGTLESYFALVLSPRDARRHVSFFSRLQDVCMEGILRSNEEYYSEIPYKTMEKITLESTLPFFDLSGRTLTDEVDALTIVTESACMEECSPEEMAMKKKKIAKTAFICSICIMTMLETLKTMNLAKPSMQDVKDFVDAPTALKGLPGLKRIEDKVNQTADTVKKSVAMGAFNTVELAKAKESLLENKKTLESFPVTESYQAQKDRILNKLNTAIEAIVEPEQKTETPITSTYVSRLKEENLANLEHGLSILGKKPTVESLQIALRSDMKTGEASKTDVEIRGLDSSGSQVATYTVSLHSLNDFGTTVAEIIHDCGNYIDLPNGKNVTIYFTDTGYSVPMKA